MMEKEMTLRDQFAMAAMHAALANEDTQRAIRALCAEHNEHTAKMTAEYAYQMADRMLAARELPDAGLAD